jgi:hypothetical protein
MTPTPDAVAIRTHLDRLFRRCAIVCPEAKFELAWTGTGRGAIDHASLFPATAEGIDTAVAEAARLNAECRNIYIGVNPRKASAPSKRSDADQVEAGFFCFVECDSTEGAKLLRTPPLPYSFAVTTGRRPHPRVHAFWELAEPITDFSTWAKLQEALGSYFHADTMIDSPRLLRLAGCVSYPRKDKIARGYQVELVTIRTCYPNGRDGDSERLPVDAATLAAAYAAQSTNRAESDSKAGDGRFNFKDRLDPEALIAEARSTKSGKVWRECMLKVTAHMVACGYDDWAILAIADRVTWDRYTVDQTRADLAKMIRGARKKWGDGADAEDEAEDFNAEPGWPEPDMSIARQGRRAPPEFPLGVCGPQWAAWIRQAADAAATPVEFVAAPLFAATSVLIGNARWAQATPGWSEPPHLWVGVVGDSGDGKSPGADCLLRDVLPQIEQSMSLDYPDKVRAWRVEMELAKAAEDIWKTEVRAAEKAKKAPPLPPVGMAPPEPQSPRLVQSDVTVEKVASLLATAAPKGLLIYRDELIGWIDSMVVYNAAGRSFWVESYGGRPFRVERQKNPEPIIVLRNAVGVFGGTQPDKLALLMRDPDDGLLGRVLWSWPEPISFRLGRATPGAEWAVSALDKLRELDLLPGRPPKPFMVRLADQAVTAMEAFGQQMQHRQKRASGLLRSSFGKARGHALRLSLVIEYLVWCGLESMSPPPNRISVGAFDAAAGLVADFFIPMAERVYGDAAVPEVERLAATLARWVLEKAPPREPVNAREIRRKARLPGLREAAKVKLAIDALVEAGWLRPASSNVGQGGRLLVAYSINPGLKGASREE